MGGARLKPVACGGGTLAAGLSETSSVGSKYVKRG